MGPLPCPPPCNSSGRGGAESAGMDAGAAASGRGTCPPARRRARIADLPRPIPQGAPLRGVQARGPQGRRRARVRHRRHRRPPEEVWCVGTPDYSQAWVDQYDIWQREIPVRRTARWRCWCLAAAAARVHQQVSICRAAKHQRPSQAHSRPPPTYHLAYTHASTHAYTHITHTRTHTNTTSQHPGIPGNVEFVDGKAGTPTVVLKHSCGSSAQVGAQHGWAAAQGPRGWRRRA